MLWIIASWFDLIGVPHTPLVSKEHVGINMAQE